MLLSDNDIISNNYQRKQIFEITLFVQKPLIRRSNPPESLNTHFSDEGEALFVQRHWKSV